MKALHAAELAILFTIDFQLQNPLACKQILDMRYFSISAHLVMKLIKTVSIVLIEIFDMRYWFLIL